MLLLATAFWGGSFLVMKALGQAQNGLMERGGSWLTSSVSLAIRFAFSALVLSLWHGRSHRSFTPMEWLEGGGLGLFCGAGLLFQMDGVMHTSASTSAFLTQCYCVFIPVAQAWHHRKLPSQRLACGCLLVMGGVVVLSNVDWTGFRLGRGETESIIGSIFFTAQILWLERPAFAANRVEATTRIMFAVVALAALSVAIWNGAETRTILAAYHSWAALTLIAFLTLASTLAAYLMMNRWQRFVPAAEAGLIYCCEPVFTSVYALFLPGWLSVMAGIHYANERPTPRLMLGGGLILAANVLVLWPSVKTKPGLANG
jgi:drug/metabolite transporter (DMT)-like permease